MQGVITWNTSKAQVSQLAMRGTQIQRDLLGLGVERAPWTDAAQQQQQDDDDDQNRQEHEDPEERALRSAINFLNTSSKGTE
jgi:hypothetical protein